ncbi:MAG: hypothetical protein JST06_03435 [Bacteroidetes bacterium]|nr:hypothetical protein [Bacteroidota bacterium]
MNPHNAHTLRFRLGPVDALSISWNACFSNIGPFVGFVVLFYIASFMLSLIPFAGVLTNLFSFVLCCAMYSGFESVARGQKLSFEALFAWTPRFGRLLGAYVLLALIMIALISPVVLYLLMNLGTQFFIEISKNSLSYVSRFSSMSALFMLGLILLSLVAILVLTVLSFGFIFIVQFRNLSIGASLRLSMAIGRENLGHIIVFVLLAFGLSLLGALACIVGLFVAVPLIYGMQYHMLRSIFPDEPDEQWDFMKGKVE